MSSATTFASLRVPASRSAVLTASGSTIPTPIQPVTLPDSLAGRTVLARGPLGTGCAYASVPPRPLPMAAVTTRPGDGTNTGFNQPCAVISVQKRNTSTQLAMLRAP